MRFLSSVNLSLSLCLLVNIAVSAQTTHFDFGEDDSSITCYDIYNPVMGGDSVRIIDGIRLNGQHKDYWPTRQIKHNGFYENGRLIYYRNYYPDGQPERFFSAKGALKHRLMVYYTDGTPKSDVTFYKGKSLLWIDYHPNGSIELFERYHRSLEYYLHLNFFKENGQAISKLDIVDKRKKLYKSQQFHENGVLHEEGKRIYNKWVGDYQKTGTWKIYDESGKLIAIEEYAHGNLISERTF